MASTLTVDTIVGATTAANVKLPAGSVIQVVHAEFATQISTSSGGDFNIVTVPITPKYSTSKFLVRGVVMGVQRGTTGGARLSVKLKRDTTLISNSGANFYTLDAQNLRHGGFSIDDLDTPSTSSTITYKLVGNWDENSSPSYINKDGNSGNSTITVMEISA